MEEQFFSGKGEYRDRWRSQELSCIWNQIVAFSHRKRAAKAAAVVSHLTHSLLAFLSLLDHSSTCSWVKSKLLGPRLNHNSLYPHPHLVVLVQNLPHQAREPLGPRCHCQTRQPPGRLLHGLKCTMGSGFPFPGTCCSEGLACVFKGWVS